MAQYKTHDRRRSTSGRQVEADARARMMGWESDHRPEQDTWAPEPEESSINWGQYAESRLHDFLRR